MKPVEIRITAENASYKGAHPSLYNIYQLDTITFLILINKSFTHITRCNAANLETIKEGTLSLSNDRTGGGYPTSIGYISL